MNKIKIIKLKSFTKKSGKLIPLNFDSKFPIPVKRIFYIYGKKIIIEAIMLIKNVNNFLFQFQEKLH